MFIEFFNYWVKKNSNDVRVPVIVYYITCTTKTRIFILYEIRY